MLIVYREMKVLTPFSVFLQLQPSHMKWIEYLTYTTVFIYNRYGYKVLFSAPNVNRFCKCLLLMFLKITTK